MTTWINYWQDTTGLWPFLIQYRSTTTGLFQPPGYEGHLTAPQVDVDRCNERRCDYFPTAGPFGQSHIDCVLETKYGGMFATQYISFPPWRSYVAEHGDGGNLVGITSDGMIRGFATADGSMQDKKLYYFIGPPNTPSSGWIMGGIDAKIDGPWIEHICQIQESYPGPNNPLSPGFIPAYTRYLRRILSIPVWFDSASPGEVNNYECFISEHYDNSIPEFSTSFERFGLVKGFGLVRWESWSKLPIIPSPHLDERAPRMAYCYPEAKGASSGFTLKDARHFMNLHYEDLDENRFRVIDADWPGEVVLP